MTPNLALRWLTIPGVLLLLADVFLIAFIVRKICALAGASSSHPVIRWLRYGILTVLVVIASAWLLSAIRLLDFRGFLALHAVAGTLLAFIRPRGAAARRDPGLSALLFLGGGPRRFQTNRGHRILLSIAGWIFAILLIYTLILSVGVFAVNWDSQTYRLSRVGYWLQERRISMNFANDSRLFYMPVNIELLMLWLTSFFPFGYPLVNLTQFLGGCLTLLSVWEMGRLSGLSRERRLLAAFLLIGIPVVFLEFATSQSDLFTSGLLNAGLVFFWRSLRNTSRLDIVFSGLAIGLALGAKSTVMYWIPGLVLWTALLLLKHRPGFRRTISVIVLSGAIALLVGGWKYADNWVRYGNPFAPSGEIARVHDQGGGSAMAKEKFIALSHLWQLVLPNSNPVFLAPFLQVSAQHLTGQIESSAPNHELLDAYRYVHDSCAGAGDLVFEDIASYGLLVPLLAVLGMMCDGFRSVRRIDPGAPLRLAMAASIAGFLIFFFHEMNLNPWNYRYFIIFAPFVAIMAAAAWPVRQIGKAAMVAAFLVMMLQAYTGFDLQNRNGLGGWRSLFDRPGGTDLFESLTAQLSSSDPRVHRVAIAVGMNCWLSPYFRQPGKRHISFVSLDTLTPRYPSPAEFLQQGKFDGLITDSGVFSAARWPEIEAKNNGLSAPFGKVLYTRIR